MNQSIIIDDKKKSNIRHINYRGILDYCNYSCHYCPFSKRTYSAKKEAMDRAALSRLLVRLQKETEDFTFQIVPYGEALLYTYYWEFLAGLSRNPRVKAVGCQTNASFPAEQMIPLFKKKGIPEKLRLWCTFHPSMISVENFVRQIERLKKYGISLCVGAVADPGQKETIFRLSSAQPEDIYFWLNRKKGRNCHYTTEDRAFFEKIDRFFPLEERHIPADPEHCLGGRRSADGNWFVNWKGDLYACNLSRVCLGNLYQYDTLSQFFVAGKAALEKHEPKCRQTECSCFLAYQNNPEFVPEIWEFLPYMGFRILGK